MLDKQRRHLRRLLEAQFGALPPDALRALALASEEALDRWTEGLPEASSLESLLR